MKFVNLSKDLITPYLAASLITTFGAAYDLASYAADTFDFLGGNLKSQTLPHLRNWAVEEELYRRSIDGTLPFHATYVPNLRRNHSHLELKYNGFLLTVSQTHKAFDLPRECVFRNEHILDGQLTLFDSIYVNSDTPPIYAILTHGYAARQPRHILCGIPSPNMKSWDQLINLYEVTSSISVVDPSPIDEEIKLSFRNSAKKRLEHA